MLPRQTEFRRQLNLTNRRLETIWISGFGIKPSLVTNFAFTTSLMDSQSSVNSRASSWAFSVSSTNSSFFQLETDIPRACRYFLSSGTFQFLKFTSISAKPAITFLYFAANFSPHQPRIHAQALTRPRAVEEYEYCLLLLISLSQVPKQLVSLRAFTNSILTFTQNVMFIQDTNNSLTRQFS